MLGVSADEVQIFDDLAKTGMTWEERPQFREAMKAAIEGGRGSVLVVYKLDRISRSSIDLQEAVAVLMDAGVRLVATDEGLDTGSSMGAMAMKITIQLIALVAELERDTIVARFSAGKEHAKAAGRRYSGKVPYGKREEESRDDAGHRIRKLVDDPQEQAVLARMRALFAEGFTSGQVVSKLHDEGLRPRHGGEWRRGNVWALVHKSTSAPKPPKENPRVARFKARLFAEDQKRRPKNTTDNGEEP
jgi:DNA invertase Pin-like site-specific DNA recombinase